MSPDSAPSFRRVLCATDFSDTAERAVDFGARLARRVEGELLLAHVVEYPAVDLEPFDMAFDFEEYREKLVGRAGDRLQEIADRCRDGDPPLKVRTVLGQGTSGPELVRLAGAEKADVLLLGATGHSGLDRVVFGSTPEAVIPEAPCPVLSVRETVPLEGFQRILVTTDFSGAAADAFPRAAAMAEIFGARLTLLHVATVYPPDPYAPAISEDGRARIEAIARERLDGLELPGERQPDERRVMRALNAQDGILRAIEDLDADLVVIATHGHTGLGAVLLGSTTASVVRYADCAVLTVRSTEGAGDGT